jgi:hypothetical protein
MATQPDLFAPCFPSPSEIPDWRRVMLDAGSADEARVVIRSFETWLHDLEAAAGLDPLCGPGGSGFWFRGLSTIRPDEFSQQLAKAPGYARDTLAAAVAMCRSANQAFLDRFYPAPMDLAKAGHAFQDGDGEGVDEEYGIAV